MSWKKEFGPEFHPEPAMLSHFARHSDVVDTSWHNDTCPSFELPGRTPDETVRIWINPENPENREYPDMPRYGVVTYSDRNGWEERTRYEGDNMYFAIVAFLRPDIDTFEFGKATELRRRDGLVLGWIVPVQSVFGPGEADNEEPVRMVGNMRIQLPLLRAEFPGDFDAFVGDWQPDRRKGHERCTGPFHDDFIGAEPFTELRRVVDPEGFEYRAYLCDDCADDMERDGTRTAIVTSDRGRIVSSSSLIMEDY